MLPPPPGPPRAAGTGRRSVLAGLAGGLLPPGLVSSGAALAQAEPRQFGLLFPGPEDAAAARARFVWEGLRERGFVEGRNLALLTRAAAFAPGALERLARDLAASEARVILAVAPPAVRAARQATATKPIVAVDLESDPVASGLVASLARPGGNLTGLFLDFPDFASKWIDLLREAVPDLVRLAVLRDPSAGAVQLDAARAAAAARGLSLQVVEASRPAEIEGAVAAALGGGAQGLVILSSPLFNAVIGGRPLAELTRRGRLPAISPFPEFAGLGGLMGYGPSIEDMFRQAGVLVARVLAGERPADIPVERPTRLTLQVNLQAARALGLVIPPLLLARADEVVE